MRTWPANSIVPLGFSSCARKLKKLSYIHAEGYPAGEMKHGPNALIDENLPVIVLATHDPSGEEGRVRYEKTLSNIQEVKAREGIVVAVVTRARRDFDDVVGHAADIRVAGTAGAHT
jgi:glucosamine--fructose-6-phosphate aminotransferase (isomerizing)